jgi:hypothetical protein
MAEPISSLPAAPQRTVPISWPQTPDHELQTSEPLQTGNFDYFIQNGRDAVERSWKRTQSAISRALSRAASRMDYVKRERPLEVLAGVAAAAFVVGAAIRLWRNRYE